MKVVLGALIGCVLCAGPGISGEPTLTVNADPRISPAPATVRLSVMVEPDDRNRALRVVTDSGEFYRASETPLDGKNSSRLQVFTFTNLPAGDYVVSARLSRAQGGDRQVETNLVVTGF